MAGILDNKTRILDTIVTELGRRQISSGKMKIEYASLTDAGAYYEFDPVSGSSDATKRIYFESPGQRRQDFITFETDDSGKLLGFPSDLSTTIKGDEIFQKDPGTSVAFNFVSSSNTFASLSEGMITASIDNFNNLYMLGSVPSSEPDALKRAFKLSTDSAEFTLFNTHPFSIGSDNAIATVDSLKPLFMDQRLSHIPNFKFLPPMNTEPRTNFSVDHEIAREAGITMDDERSRKDQMKARSIAAQKLFLAEYASLSDAGLSAEGMSIFDILRHLNGEDMMDPDYGSDTYSQSELLSLSSGDSRNYSEQSQTVLGQDMGTVNLTATEIEIDRKNIYFTETSSENNIIMQMFEVNSDLSTFKKLDVIDFGEFSISTDPVRPNKHVFFVGKIYEDTIGVPKFVNLFTIILD
jgi:hypothetical protein